MAHRPKRGGGLRLLRVTALISLIAVIATACSGDPETVATQPDPDTTTAVVPVTAIDVPVDQLLPSEVVGVELEMIVVPGESFGADEVLAAALESMGRTPADVSFALAFTPRDSSLGFSIGVLRIEGFDWTSSLEILLDRLREVAGEAVEVTPMTIANRDVVRLVAVGEPDILPTYYHTLGDVLVYAHSSDEGAVAEALDQVVAAAETGPSSTVTRTPARPPIGVTDPQGVKLDDGNGHAVYLRGLSAVVHGPDYACTNWFETFVFVLFGVFDIYIGDSLNSSLVIPPDNVIAGVTDPIPRLGEADIDLDRMWKSYVEVVYKAFAVDGQGPDEFGLAVRADWDLATVQEGLPPFPRWDFTSGPFDVRLCLSGLWQDGPRVLRVVHQGTTLSAVISEGELRCGGAGELSFTALITGAFPNGDAVLAGVDLLVCNPQRCVDDGKLPSSERVPFEGIAFNHGRTIRIEWDAQQFDDECEPTHTLPDGFNISLNSIAPPRPD